MAAKATNVSAAIINHDGRLVDLTIRRELLGAGTLKRLLREYSGTRWHEFIHPDDVRPVMLFISTTRATCWFRIQGLTRRWRITASKQVHGAYSLVIMSITRDSECDPNVTPSIRMK